MSKRILITGGAGFIAHHVISYILHNTDWNIVTLDRLDFSGNLNRLVDILEDIPQERNRVQIVYHDLKSEVNPTIAGMLGDVNVVLHLAAGSHVDRSIERPMEFVMDNVVGTVNLLEYARTLNNLEKFVYFSTDEVFGPAPVGVNYSEYDRYNSTNPYSASKAGGEEMCVAYENTYKLPIVITHTMNVFGERQHPEKFIPLVIQRVRDGEKIRIHADPTKTVPGSRHYIHAQDVAEGLMFVLTQLKDYTYFNEYDLRMIPKFNLVGPEETDNLTLARLIAEVQGRDLVYELTDFHSARPGHDLRYALSGDLLADLGWRPKIKFSERIRQVTEWSLANKRWLLK
jgi:dTDP-glucose 4,6-dehydratase